MIVFVQLLYSGQQCCVKVSLFSNRRLHPSEGAGQNRTHTHHRSLAFVWPTRYFNGICL